MSIPAITQRSIGFARAMSAPETVGNRLRFHDLDQEAAG